MLLCFITDVLKNIPNKSEFVTRLDLPPMPKLYSKYILMRYFAALNPTGVAMPAR